MFFLFVLFSPLFCSQCLQNTKKANQLIVITLLIEKLILGNGCSQPVGVHDCLSSASIISTLKPSTATPLEQRCMTSQQEKQFYYMTIVSAHSWHGGNGGWRELKCDEGVVACGKIQFTKWLWCCHNANVWIKSYGKWQLLHWHQQYSWSGAHTPTDRLISITDNIIWMVPNNRQHQSCKY